MESKTEAFGKLILRLTVGGLMLFHGIAKIQGGLAGIEGMLTAKGLPTFISYGVYVGEILVPLLLLAGLFTRLSALVLMGNMAIAVYLAHSGDFLSLTGHGGWALELQAFYFFGALAILLLGPGCFSFDASWKSNRGAKADPDADTE